MSASPVAPNRIEHVVSLVLENRSFDHLLGDLGRSGVLPIDGGDATMVNKDINGAAVALNPVNATVGPDLPHDFASVGLSLADDNGGFVRADQLQRRFASPADPSRVMAYFRSGSLPVSHQLAREYVVCDRWFASVPAGTWPNRLFLVAASSVGRVTNTLPNMLFDLPTVFDRLDPGDWAIYNDQIPNVALFRKLAIEWGKSRLFGGHFRSMSQFYEACSRATLPYFSFIEPVYLGAAADDGHPPHDIAASERLIGRVYSALRHSPLWAKSLLLVLYDEHGGFFDHVRPPHGVPAPSPDLGEYSFAFSSLGVRTPSLIVSPYVARGQRWRPPDGRYVDHTSLIATVLRHAGREPLSARDAAVADVWGALTEPDARTDDAATIAAVDDWLEGQEVAAARDFHDSLDPEHLANMSGREVALEILRASPAGFATPDQPDGVVYRGLTPVAGYAPPAIGDLTLEQALANLAQAVVSLPTDGM